MGATPRAIGALWRQACARIERNDARYLLQYVGDFTHADLVAHAERDVFEIAKHRHADGIGKGGHGVLQKNRSAKYTPHPRSFWCRGGRAI